MKETGWLCLTLVCLVLVSVVMAEVVATAAIMTLITVVALSLAWMRFVPRPLKLALTTYPGMVLIEGTMWILGFKVLPDSTHAKISFLMSHVALVPLILFERKRLRNRISWLKSGKKATKV